MDILSVLLNQTSFFLLVFARITGLFSSAPFFSSRNIPVYVKAGTSLLISYIVFPMVFSTNTFIPETFGAYGLLVASEFLLGLIFGFVSYLIFYAAQMAGHLIDLQIGFGIVNVFDPQFGQQIPLIGNFQFILALLVFLVINGHHVLLTALISSFKLVPLTGVIFHPSLADLFIELFAGIFIIAVKISLPVLVALILTDVALGILARTMPQMNIFVVGIPGKLIIGIFTLSVGLPFYVYFLEVGFNAMYQNVYRLLALFR